MDAINNIKLIEQAQDSRAARLTRIECNLLWEQASRAIVQNRYPEAFASVEALLCQADWGGEVVPDLLCDPRLTMLRGGRTLPMLQGLLDRVEALNFHCARR